MSPLAQQNLIFLIAAPRSGSTLLQRMLGSHSRIFTHPEPHLITPLAYLGYHDTVDKAPYDHINAAKAFREFVEQLPHGETDYLDALRAYANTLYERVLPTGRSHFLDKTPAYALVLPFLTRLYPEARYVVLTRHPLAILHSVARSFFDGDYERAHAFNPVVTRYVPAIGRMLRAQSVERLLHVRYDDLVQAPEQTMQRLCGGLALPYEAGTVTYGQYEHISKSYGDPMSVERHDRPVTESLNRWADDLLARPQVRALAERIVAELDDQDLEAWGYPRASLFDPLQNATPSRKRSRLNGYRLQRKVLLALRRDIQRSTLGGIVKKVRYYCDALLRDQL